MRTSVEHVDPSGLYNCRQAADALGVSVSTIWRYTRCGTLHALYAASDGRPRYRGSELRALFHSLRPRRR